MEESKILTFNKDLDKNINWKHLHQELKYNLWIPQ